MAVATFRKGQLPLTDVPRITPPRLDGQPDFPEPGIYFGMSEDVYQAIHACSASGLKKLSASSMDYWADSPLNAEREEPKEGTKAGDLTPRELGRAYHCRICEGATEYLKRYAVALDKADHPDALITVADLREAITNWGEKPKGAAKEPLIEQLLAIAPGAKIWDRMVSDHGRKNAGKILISQKLFRRIEIAWAMIAADPQLGQAFSGGHAEVSIFWYDKETGCPMKARLDYLKMNHLIDLKSFSNPFGKPVQRAIDAAISNNKYYIPVVVYLEAIAAAKEMVRVSKGKCVFFPVMPEKDDDQKTPYWMEASGDLAKWCWDWAHQPEPEVLFIFQQTGKAPVTRGRIMSKGTTFEVTNYAVQTLKREWCRCAQTFGTDPWISMEEVVRTTDENMTWSATDFGEIG